MSRPRLAIFGAGFWIAFQPAAWREIDGADCVAIYNQTRSKTERLARDFGIAAVRDDPAALLDRESSISVDIVTDVDSHAPSTTLAAEYGRSVICQNPLAPTLLLAQQMRDAYAPAGTRLLAHENWRWQRPSVQ